VALANIELMERENNCRKRPREGRHWPLFGAALPSLNDHPLVAAAETCGFVAGLVLVIVDIYADWYSEIHRK
jgi:putrescine aminotransferase